MKLFQGGRVGSYLCGLSLSIVVCIANRAPAAFVFVGDTSGNVWMYQNVADMAGQTSTTNTGTLIRDASIVGNAYGTDQAATMDLSTGKVYRITLAGDIISYNDLPGYISNTNGTLVGTPGAYGGTKKVVDLSYDGGTGGFYAVAATGATGFAKNPAGTFASPGDVVQFSNLTRFFASNNNAAQTLTTANYAAALLNFYDPDPTHGTTVGGTPPSKVIDAHYFQVSGQGRLEGFESLADYDQSSNNRINVTGLNAFGGTSLYQSTTAFAVTQQFFAIPEASSLLIWFGIVVGTTIIRRR